MLQNAIATGPYCNCSKSSDRELFRTGTLNLAEEADAAGPKFDCIAFWRCSANETDKKVARNGNHHCLYEKNCSRGNTIGMTFVKSRRILGYKAYSRDDTRMW